MYLSQYQLSSWVVANYSQNISFSQIKNGLRKKYEIDAHPILLDRTDYVIREFSHIVEKVRPLFTGSSINYTTRWYRRLMEKKGGTRQPKVAKQYDINNASTEIGILICFLQKFYLSLKKMELLP